MEDASSHLTDQTNQSGHAHLPDSSEKLRWVLIWKVVLCVHLVGAGFAWWLMPHGFAWSHPRFWVNEILPWIALALCVVGLYGLLAHRVSLARFVMSGLIATYFAAGVAGLVCFPISGRRPALAAMVLGIFLLFIGWLSWRKCGRRRASALAGTVAGVLLGIVLPLSQRGVDPATHPAETYIRKLPLGGQASRPPAVFRFADFASVSSSSGYIVTDFGDVRVSIDPLLGFTSRSPDRCWTILAPRRYRVSPLPRLTDWSHTDGSAAMYFDGAESAKLSVDLSTAKTIRLEAKTFLPQPVYSHLNSYCEMDIQGHESLFLAFSPCPQERIEVVFSQYPVGRPARFAYLDAAGVFHVVQASSGEKGPFAELARGPLARDELLAITLYNNDLPVGRITLSDFAAQASTQPSPTAGWGVPENAIEFKLFADRPDALAGVWVTLAGTSVGRGWDSVGHASGSYRNRMQLEVLDGQSSGH
ncbi:MAG: hypothetical protein R3C45_09505 [Phycisphaerales bacterium]